MNAGADTIAYWRFEGDGATTPTDGTFLKDSNGRTTVTGDGILAIDSSGNGNSLYTWDNGATGHQYRNNVPAAIIPQTGAANGFSIQNNGSFPASFTWSRESSETVDVELIKPTAWTIEASIYQTTGNQTGHRTFLGRDGNGVNAGNANAASLYFKTYNATLGIEFADEAGNWYSVYDTTGTLSLDTWYNVAAVSDGTAVSLYRDSGTGYQLVNALSLTAGDTRLAYDDNGSSTVGDTQWSWTVGRGRYGTNDEQSQNHVDRWLGYVDEVRISDTALNTGDLLFSVPEPGTAGLSVLGLLALLLRRRAVQE